jgi:hypothetical protein
VMPERCQPDGCVRRGAVVVVAASVVGQDGGGGAVDEVQPVVKSETAD